MNDFLEFLYAHIPHRWLNQKAKGTKKLFEGLAKNINYIYDFVTMVDRNNHTRKAEEILIDLENEYGITVNPSYDLEFRRERILAKIRMQDSPITERQLVSILEMMGFYDIEIVPDIGKFQIDISIKVLEEYRYKVYEIQQILEESIRAHIGIYWKTISELFFEDNYCYVGGAVFRPIAETVLSEIEYPYQFHTTISIGGTFQNIMETTLPELEFRTSAMMHLAADWCEIEQTILSEMKI